MAVVNQAVVLTVDAALDADSEHALMTQMVTHTRPSHSCSAGLVFSHHVVDDTKESTKGDFWTKLHQADCHLCVTKPYSLVMQTAGGCIRGL